MGELLPIWNLFLFILIWDHVGLYENIHTFPESISLPTKLKVLFVMD